MNSQIPRFRSLALVAVGAAALALSTQIHAVPQYRIFYLGRLGTGSTGSQAFGLNDVGAVVGQSNFKAFVWLFQPLYGFNSFTITQLATNNFTSTANDINNAGYAVGQGQQSSGVDPEAYGWRLDLGTVTASPFGTFDGGFSSEAFGINEASTPVVVGKSEGTNPLCGLQQMPFKADFDTTPSLDLLGTTSQISASANGIDNSATPRIVGTSNTDLLSCTVLSVCSGGDGNDAKQWLGAGVTTLQDFNPLIGFNPSHEAMDVNDQGQIAGTGFEFPNPGSLIECRRDSLFWASSTAAPVRLVPDVAADGAFARAIRNQLGSGEVQVVGQNTTDERALLWIRTGTTWTTYKLIDRLLQVNGWSSLRDATDINECGWIVGFGFLGGLSRAYLLVPTVPACFADLNGDCKVNGFDLALLLGDDGNPDCATRTCLGDLDWTNGPDPDDTAGDVDSYDLAILLGAWTGANLCSEDCVEGWGGCGSAGGESAMSDGAPILG